MENKQSLAGKAGKNILITGLIAVVMLGAGFFAGMKYQQSKRVSFTGNGQFNRNSMMGSSAPRGNGFRPVNGEITAVDDKSITVKLVDGSSKIVILSETTEYNKAAEATKADAKVGDKVAVFGTDNTDGSVTAQSVQLHPIIRALTSPLPAN